MCDQPEIPKMERGDAECSTGSGCPICDMATTPKGRWGLLAILIVVAALITWQQMKGGDDPAPGAQASSDVDRLLLDGQTLYADRQFDAAAEAFKQALDLDDNRPLAMNYLGTMARDRGDVDEAEDWFKKAIEIDPNTPQHYYNLALLLVYERQDYEAAEAALNHAKRLGVKSMYYMLYALCGERRGVPEEELVRRYVNVIRFGEAQATELRADQLGPHDSFAEIWMSATKKLLEHGNDFGIRRLRHLATSENDKLRTFAQRLLTAYEENH
jgi:tetratricopeptide (TPR) repeat protein